MNKKLLFKMKKYQSLYIMLIPIMLYFFVFSYYPLILGIIQSFFQTNLLGVGDFVALKNYQDVFSDINFQEAFFNTTIMAIGTLILSVIFSLVLSISINELHHAISKRFIQTVSYIPYLLSWTVVGGMFIFFLRSDGFVSAFFELFGAEKTNFLIDPTWSRSIMIFTAAWKQAGYGALLLITAITGIKSNIYEAAMIDGASRWRQIKALIVPLIVPTIKVMVLLQIVGMLRIFEQVLVMQNPVIISKIRTLLLYTYEEGILNFNIGKASASAVIILVVTLIITVIANSSMQTKD